MNIWTHLSRAAFALAFALNLCAQSGTLLTGFDVGTLRNNFSSWVGLSFTVGATPLSVTQLGRVYVAGNTGTHTLKLVNATGADIAGGSVTVVLPSGTTPGQFIYATLAAPVPLAANTQYYLVSQELAGGDQWYDVTGVHMSGVASGNGSTYFDGTNYFTNCCGNYSYIPVDFKYGTAPPPPPPPPPPTGLTPLITSTGASTLRNNYAGWVGMMFTPSTAMTVGSLGRFCATGNNATHQLKLVAAGTGADVAGSLVTVNMAGCTIGQFVYGTLAGSLSLAAGSSYYALSKEVAGGDLWPDTSGVTTTAVGVETSSPVNVGYVAAVVPPATGGMNYVQITGQSLALAFFGNPALTTTQPYFNVMLNSNLTALIPLVEGSAVSIIGTPVETVASSAGNILTSLSPGFISGWGNDAVGGAPYSVLKKGGPAAYAFGLQQVTAAKNLATAQSQTYKVAGLVVLHGEAPESTRDLGYEAELVQWQSDFQADAQAISGQTTPVPMFIDQENSWTYYGFPTSVIVQAQLAAAEDNPGKIVLVGPKYQYVYADGLHMVNVAYRQQGEQFGKVMKNVLVDGAAWRPLSPNGISRSGTTITVPFHVPVPPLRFDTAWVLPQANMGFEYTDGSGTPPTITSVTITAPDTVTLTLSAAPAGPGQVCYACTGQPGSFAGRNSVGSARGNLKDSDATPSLSGNDLSNWAVVFQKPVN